MNMDREFYQVVDAESGFPLSLPGQAVNEFGNEEEARSAAWEQCLERRIRVTILKLCRTEITTFSPVTTVTETPAGQAAP